MKYKGTIKNNVVVLEERVSLPDGTPVTVISEGEENKTSIRAEQWRHFGKGVDQIFQRLQQEVGVTSDSVEILRQLREERAKRRTSES